MDAQGPDPGESENRLSLNPNDERWAEALETWEDGGQYTVTLTISQISPGEFDVIDADVRESEAAAEKAPKTEKAQADKAVKGLTNPAVIALLGANR